MRVRSILGVRVLEWWGSLHPPMILTRELLEEELTAHIHEWDSTSQYPYY